MDEFKSLRPKINFSAKEEYGVEIPAAKNISVVHHDYQGTYSKRPDPIYFESDYSDILAGPFFDPLLIDTQIQKEEHPENFQKAEDLYLQYTSKYPILKKKALPDVVDQSKITQEFEHAGKSVYQMDFCKAETRKGRAEAKGNVPVLKLPSDWVIAQSMQNTSYRNFTKMQDQQLITFEMGAKPYLPPPNALGFTKEEHEILHTTTGETDYGEFISNSGRDIIKEAFYGEIKPLPREFKPIEGEHP